MTDKPLPEDDFRRAAWVARIARPSLREGETLPFIKGAAASLGRNL